MGLVPGSIHRRYLTRRENPISEIRRSYDRLTSTMGFLILVRLHLCDQGPDFITVEGCQSPLNLCSKSLSSPLGFQTHIYIIKILWGTSRHIKTKIFRNELSICRINAAWRHIPTDTNDEMKKNIITPKWNHSVLFWRNNHIIITSCLRRDTAFSALYMRT